MLILSSQRWGNATCPCAYGFPAMVSIKRATRAESHRRSAIALSIITLIGVLFTNMFTYNDLDNPDGNTCLHEDASEGPDCCIVRCGKIYD